MIRSAARTRSGITLVEIMISIFIMGIGVISIATLFPLGLIRMRNAQRLTRGAYLVESAAADLGSRNLLAEATFYHNLAASPWYITSATTYDPFYNPLYVDTQSYGAQWGPPGACAGANRYLSAIQQVGPGLPVCYDPLWRCVTGSYPDPIKTSTPEFRFGSGIGILRSDPPDSKFPHAHGLQRLSNFQATMTGSGIALQTASLGQVMSNTTAVLNIFISPEDLILQESNGIYLNPSTAGSKSPQQLVGPSTVVPALSDFSNSATLATSATNDWRYSWFFTGTQTDSSATAVDGSIVICENRPFGIDQVGSNTSYKVTGEAVVEAIYGYTSSPSVSGATTGYGSLSALRSVYLRWPASQPDPDVRVGGWFADVTYERDQSRVPTHFPNQFPAQRCYWYQIAKKSDVTDDPNVFGGENGSYRRMTVWTTSPLQAQSLLSFNANGAATPVHVEAALIMPSVVNVYTRTVYTR